MRFHGMIFLNAYHQPHMKHGWKQTIFRINKIPLGHNRTNGAVYFKINFIGEMLCTLVFRYSIVIPCFIPYNPKRNPNNHCNHGFHNTFNYNTLCIVTIYVHSDCQCSHYTLVSICDIIVTLKLKGLYNI